MTDQPGHEDAPLLRVVRGTPDDAELAALTAVLAAATAVPGNDVPAPRPRRSLWADRAALLRRPPPHGPGAWRASGLPR